MNRKHPSTKQGMQSHQPTGTRSAQWGQNSQYGQNSQGHDQDQEQDYEGMKMNGSRAPSKADFSGRSSWAADDSLSESGRSSYRDTDYDLDRSTYGSQYGSQYGNQERSPRSMDRNSSSSERFGYPSNMDAWSGSDKGFFGKGPKGYKRSDDRIKEDVCEALSRSARVDASDIEVTVEDAMVTLSGTVDTRDARRAAEMVIEDLSGVDDIKNEIRVKRASDVGSDSSMDASGSFVSKSQSANSKSATKGAGHL